MTGNLLAALDAQRDAMSASDRAIADYVIEHAAEVTGLSSQALAQRCHVSQSSVIKFCQRHGFAGFPAFKIALSAELARHENARQVHAGIFSDDSVGAVARKLFDSKLSALSDTMKLNDNADLEAAAELIDRAGRVLIMGVGGSALVAEDLGSKLAKFGKAVVAGGDSHIQLANLASLTPDDLLIAISYSGRTKEIAVAVEHARAQAIPTLIIGAASAPPPPPGRLLRCVADENVVRSASIATRTAQLAITDLVFVLFVQRRDDAARRIAASRALVEALR